MAVATQPRRGRGKSSKSLTLIDASVEILRQIQPASVRAVAYQLFGLKLIPSMAKAETNRVSALLTWAREQGIVPWGWIVDGTRSVERVPSWNDPGDMLDAALAQYRRDWWEQQEYKIVVASEKSTVQGTIRPVTRQYGVGYLSLHGYGSATALHDLAQASIADDRILVIVYCGDWDPSGLHMSEVDLRERFERYSGQAVFQRVALDVADLFDLGSATFSVGEKRQDPRYRWFTEERGQWVCCELDALSPNVLRGRVENAIVEHIDQAAWNRCKAVEEAQRASLNDVVVAWKAANP